jgi:CRP-like cAMP-binding protein
VLHIPHAELLAISLRYPAIALAFWRDTVADAAVLAKWVSNLGRKDAREAMAHLLCEIGMRMERAGLGTGELFNLQATQEQLAEAPGISPVHTNRTLQALRVEGLVTFCARTMQILDWDGLASIGEFDERYMLLEPRATRAAA